MAALVAGVSFASVPEAADAGPADCPPGLQKQGRCVEHMSRQLNKADGGYRDGLRYSDDLDDAYDEGYRDALEDLRVGDRLSRDRYRVLDRDLYRDSYGRPLDDGYYDAEAKGERFLIEAATGAIVDMLLR